jgi:hexosaminidase
MQSTDSDAPRLPTACAALAAITLLGAGCAGEGTDMATVDDEPIASLSLIPIPNSISGERGHLHFDAGSRIVVAAQTEQAGELLADTLRPSTGWPWEVVQSTPAPGDIVLQLATDRNDLGEEGYELAVDRRQVWIRGPTAAGVFYGTQTLIQLLPSEVEQNVSLDGVVWRVPMVTIEDWPRFPWRGVMLDVARHFFDAEQVKRLIDLAARYKINRFHLHLTDDSGWRIEIQSWPELTATGSTTDYSDGPGGFFTQEDLQDIVAHARARQVTIVPEIDMPGHTNAALASYAELNESGERTELTPTVPLGSSSLWIDGPRTAQFVDDVVGEIAALVPDPYMHVGGDEAFATSEEDYAAFMSMAQDAMKRHGKTMVGWEEIGRAQLDTPFIAQHWLSSDPVIAARDQGARIISSPARFAYLDMKYDESTPIGMAWAGYIDVRTAYEWDPVIESLTEFDVIGIEAPLWTETIDNADDIDFMMFPRLLGYAELGWSRREVRDWEEYRTRLAQHGPRLQARGVGFFRSPLVDWPEP